MRKALILVLLFSISLIIIYFFPGWYELYKSWRSKEMIESLLAKCPIPDKGGVNICCYEDSEVHLCNEKDVLECGEKIEVRIRLDEIDVPSYVCINQTFYPPLPIEPTDWTVLYPDAIFTCSEDPIPDPDVLTPVTRLPVDFLLSGIIYNTTGLRKLVEVITFPIKNYTTPASLLEDLGSSKTVLKVEKMIICWS